MRERHSIHRQVIATGREWRPCVECKKAFEAGEILTAIDTHSGAGVVSWICEACTHRFYGHLLARSWRRTWVLRRRDGRTDAVDLNTASYGDAG